MATTAPLEPDDAEVAETWGRTNLADITGGRASIYPPQPNGAAMAARPTDPADELLVNTNNAPDPDDGPQTGDVIYMTDNEREMFES